MICNNSGPSLDTMARLLHDCGGRMRPRISGDGRGQLGLAVLACGLLAGSAFVPARAHAEAADVGPSSPDIVVTARRIEEAPSALPFSVTVIGGREAQDRRTDDLESALRRTVGVEVSSFNDANNASVRIRGVGALQKVSSDDSSVAVHIDGMPVSIASAVTNLVDIERIEILKGPQGTIFGRNSEAGAINIVTKRPSSTPGGYLRAEAGEQMQRLVEGAFGGPLAETLAARGAFRFSGSNHNVINQRDGEPITRPRDQLFRGGLLWSPTSDTSLFLSAEHQEINARAVLFVLRPYPGLFGAYNAGPRRYADHLASGRPLPGETVGYLATVAPSASTAAVTVIRAVPPQSIFAVRRNGPPAETDRASVTPPASLFVTLSQRD